MGRHQRSLQDLMPPPNCLKNIGLVKNAKGNCQSCRDDTILATGQPDRAMCKSLWTAAVRIKCHRLPAAW